MKNILLCLTLNIFSLLSISVKPSLVLHSSFRDLFNHRNTALLSGFIYEEVEVQSLEVLCRDVVEGKDRLGK